MMYVANGIKHFCRLNFTLYDEIFQKKYIHVVIEDMEFPAE